MCPPIFLILSSLVLFSDRRRRRPRRCCCRLLLLLRSHGCFALFSLSLRTQQTFPSFSTIIDLYIRIYTSAKVALVRNPTFSYNVAHVPSCSCSRINLHCKVHRTSRTGKYSPFQFIYKCIYRLDAVRIRIAVFISDCFLVHLHSLKNWYNSFITHSTIVRVQSAHFNMMHFTSIYLSVRHVSRRSFYSWFPLFLHILFCLQEILNLCGKIFDCNRMDWINQSVRLNRRDFLTIGWIDTRTYIRFRVPPCGYSLQIL